MVSKCRACGSELTDLFTLGTMAFTGRFPKPDEVIPSGELGLALCEHCGLVQLPHKFDPGELYREDYGYRSSLNSSMASHLSRKAFQLNSRYQPKSVLDIGSNDGTTLNAFLSNGVTRLVGVDPIASFLSDSYQPGISIVSDFSQQNRWRKGTLVPSISAHQSRCSTILKSPWSSRTPFIRR